LPAIDTGSEDRVIATNRAMGPAEWLLLVGLSVLWGGSFFCSEVALAELPPFTVVLGRVGLAAAALAIAVLAGGASARRARCGSGVPSWRWACSTT
jgi:drug/metabolite transporter (DMT)-like permease